MGQKELNFYNNEKINKNEILNKNFIKNNNNEKNNNNDKNTIQYRNKINNNFFNNNNNISSKLNIINFPSTNYEQTLSIEETIYSNDIFSYIKIQSIYRGYIYRKKYNEYIKESLSKHENDLFNDLYENYMKFNTKLSESSIGYKFEAKNKNIDIETNNKKLYFTKIHISKLILKSIYSGFTDILYKYNGNGMLLYNDGSKHTGYFKDNFLYYGRIINSNGDLYEGYFEKNKIYGTGLKKKLNGDKYIGEFKNNLKNGKGKEETMEYIYEGEFLKDKKNGKGKIYFKKLNESYEGEFRDNIINGIGIYTFNNEDIYKGNFSNGKMNGMGEYFWKSGEYYYGEYINGIKEGVGKFKYKNGKRYEGMFKNGKPNGRGKIKYNDKEIEVEFNNGKLIKNNI